MHLNSASGRVLARAYSELLRPLPISNRFHRMLRELLRHYDVPKEYRVRYKDFDMFLAFEAGDFLDYLINIWNRDCEFVENQELVGLVEAELMYLDTLRVSHHLSFDDYCHEVSSFLGTTSLELRTKVFHNILMESLKV